MGRDELELKILITIEQIADSICQGIRSQESNEDEDYHVYISFDKDEKNMYYLSPADENDEYNFKLSKEKPQIKFLTADNKIFIIRLVKGKNKK